MNNDKRRFVATAKGFYYRLIDQGEIFGAPKDFKAKWCTPVDGSISEDEYIDPSSESVNELGVTIKRKKGE